MSVYTSVIVLSPYDDDDEDEEEKRSNIFSISAQHPDDDTVKGQYREIAKRMETLLEKCEDKDKGTAGGEIRNRISHLRVQYDDEECSVKKPDNF
ncbi:uncharacterized protein APUU_70894A [Aspergillus puulaauensis]|uniref:Uncharacterized protein n=1 Tax=Aspergillus puulaauensis TaxID=1220207 RepID=A0A7R7XZ64_9EURO|nr:uncharacterized protein APUU_70894A [Aspergillus puulaauensis]BCS29324.1 hypothetical protein APUU_70894A [Aspergillus puulaauensis]